jgi:hypothetical protein
MTIYPVPKPLKGRNRPSIIRRINRSDGKAVEIRLSRSAWEERREEVGERASFRCEYCFGPAPLHGVEIEREGGLMPVEIRAGQAAHRTPRRMGSGSRDDSTDNLMWLCWKCHHLQTVGKLVIE